MNTQIVFKVDKKIKARAMKRAKNEGIPFASVLKFATRAFADGKLTIDIIERPNAQTRRILDAALRDIKEGDGKNFSPVFSDMREARRWIEKR